MISFMLVAPPRCGTTWAANWLSTDTTHCLHDPLFMHHYSDWDAIPRPSGKSLGVACTGVFRFPEFLNSHKARKVILHRDEQSIVQSLAALGVPAREGQWEPELRKINGWHCHYSDLFSAATAMPIYEWLTQRQFDPARHELLRAMLIEPMFGNIPANPEVLQRLQLELKGI